MSNLSLEKSIRTCKVATGWADRMQSDRFLNPSQMTCVTWNGFNSKGQRVCQDSFNTKTAGCNSAEDRVVVENNLRPQYSDYVTLNVAGINGYIYGNQMAHDGAVKLQQDVRNTGNITGNFGLQMGANTATFCGVGSKQRACNQACGAQKNRQHQAMQLGQNARRQASCSGF